MAYVISLLSSQAQLWAMAEVQNDSDVCASFKAFSDELRKVFDPVKPETETSHLFFSLSQGTRSVAQYTIEFRILPCMMPSIRACLKKSRMN